MVECVEGFSEGERGDVVGVVSDVEGERFGYCFEKVKKISDIEWYWGCELCVIVFIVIVEIIIKGFSCVIWVLVCRIVFMLFLYIVWLV